MQRQPSVAEVTPRTKQAKPFILTHESIFLNVDFENESVQGYSVLHFRDVLSSEKELRLNSRQSSITSVSVNNIPAVYTYKDPLSHILPHSSHSSVHQHPEYRNQYTYALQEADEGELVVQLPEAVSNPQHTSTDGNTVYVAHEILQVRVDFSLQSPKAGLHFVLPQAGTASDSYPQLYTSNQACSARLWMPCLDRVSEKCTWEIVVVTPGLLRDALPCIFGPSRSGHEGDPQTEVRDGDRELVVTSAGELVHSATHPTDETKRVTIHKLYTPVCAADILLAIGPFEIIQLSNWRRKAGPHEFDQQLDDGLTYNGDSDHPDLIEDDDELAVALSLPGRHEQVEYTISFIGEALAFYERFFGYHYPFESFKLVFVEDLYNPIVVGASIVLCSTHLLLADDVIDQTYSTTRLLAYSLASQWFGQYITVKQWADCWLITGIANFATGLLLEKLFGKNEFRFRLRKDIQRVCELDVNQPPLYPILSHQNDDPDDEIKQMIDPLLLHHFSPEDDWGHVRSEFINLKAPLVILMLRKRMGKGMLQKLLMKLLASAAAEELPNGLSTHHFLRLARKLTGKLELKSFADQWIYGSGCPRFSFKYTFNRKKMMVEFKFHQENTNGKAVGSTPRFTGPFTIRVHEPGGTYDTEVHIEDTDKQFDIQYHTKYKRIRRKPAVKGKKVPDGAESVDPPPQPSALDPADATKVIEWNDEEPDRLTFEWIRLDPDCDWVCIKAFEQSDFMWAAQLQKDRNLHAQFEAIEALQHLPSQGTCSALCAIVTDVTAFYGVRMEAALALATCSSEQKGLFGAQALFDIFRTRFCFTDIPDPLRALPKSNNFTDLQEYFLKKAIITAFSKVRDKEDIAPVSFRKILLDLLKFNDNTGNTFSDNYYVSDLILALGNAFLPVASRGPKRARVPLKLNAGDVEEFQFGGDSDEDDFNPMGSGRLESVQLLKESAKEIHRYRNLDRLMPSYHNTVTVTCLKVLLRWMIAGLLPVDLALFLQHARYGNFEHVRIIALEALIVLDGLGSPDITSWMLSVIRDDPAPYVRYHVAKGILEYVATAMADGKSGSANPQTYDIQGTPSKNTLPSTMSQSKSRTWEGLRYRLSQRDDIARGVWDILNLSPTLDHRIRTKMLRLCELLYEPMSHAGSSLSATPSVTKLRIKMPTRPADDSASEDEMPQPFRKVILKADFPKVRPPKYDDSRVEERVPIPTPEPQVKLMLPLSKPSPHFLELSQAVLTRLRNHPSCASFILPVDQSNVHYHQTIRRPMDLQTAGRNLEAGVYCDDLNRLFLDIRQIFKNCYEYNLEESNVYRQAKRLEEFFESTVVPEAVNAKTVSETEETPSKPPSKPQPKPQSKPQFKPQFKPLSKPLFDRKICLRVLRRLQRLPTAAPFLQPVDPIALNIPQYFDIIRKPMDFSTVQRKLDAGEYSTMEDFRDDIKLILDNCFKFNLPGDWVYEQGKALEASFKKEWEAASTKEPRDEPRPSKPITPHRKRGDSEDDAIGSPELEVPAQELTQSERQGIEDLVLKLRGHTSAAIFLEPVDRNVLPDYYDRIKQPIDLQTILSKLRGGKYKRPSAFEADVQLLIANCYAYNPKTSYGHTCGQAFEKFFKKNWKLLKETTLEADKKRKRGSVTPTPTGKGKRPKTLENTSGKAEQRKVNRKPVATGAMPTEPPTPISKGFKLKLTVKK
ncbi:hypothetical protein DFS34DRAFT_637443 [Phlyctochytrium arcticum]|nr:hypothetical protein DFS34DRAFT_637443 [Phlyctochytrium arcticum]